MKRGTIQSPEFALLKKVARRGIAKIGVITSSSGYGEEGLKQLEAQAEGAGIEIVTTEQFSDSDADMTVQLTRIKSTEAQAVVCWGVGKAPALIAKNMARRRQQ